jgi:large subunit ribosomal protein L35
MKNKAKTHKSSAKRLRITRTGKVMAAKAFKSHLLAHKARKRKMRLKGVQTVSKAAGCNVHKCLPYA